MFAWSEWWACVCIEAEKPEIALSMSRGYEPSKHIPRDTRFLQWLRKFVPCIYRLDMIGLGDRAVKGYEIHYGHLSSKQQAINVLLTHELRSDWIGVGGTPAAAS